jgi:transmembrane sensor
MSDGQNLMRQIARAGARMDPALSDRDVERLVAGAHQRRRRRKVRRIALAGGAVGALAFALAMVAHRASNPPRQELIAKRRTEPSVGTDRILRLADGSIAVALDPATEIAVAEDLTFRIGLSLARGRGRFEVTRRPARPFVVRAGEVTITVVGTVFTVERVADRVGVSVERGTVRVDWGVGSALLRKGESGWYPPLLISAPNGRAGTEEKRTPSPHVGTADRTPVLASSRGGASAPESPKVESAEDLLVAADSARLAGHADQGADLLRKLLREHGNDPRAPLAAFTLGRMLLMELARPRDAAAAFAEVRRLSPEGPFAEDALAREVESLRQSGRAAEAHTQAEEYLRLYPSGRRTATVKSMGGIE